MTREIPASVEVEKHILGAALLFPDELDFLTATLSAEDFYSPRHAALYRVLLDLHAKGAEPSPQGVIHALAASGGLQDEGMEDYVWTVATEVASGAGLAHHVQIVKDLAARRRLIRTLSECMDLAYNGAKPYAEVQEHAEAAVMGVGDSRKTGPKLRTMGQVLASAAKEWEAVAKGKPGGLLTKVAPVDGLTLGLRPGKLYVLAARPGLGKSMLALQMAAQCGAPVTIYSLEMLAEEQSERMISQESDMNSDSLRSSSVLQVRQKELMDVMLKLKGLPIHWCDEPVTPAQIMAQSRRSLKSGGLGLVVVDYLQLLKVAGKFERRDLEVGATSKALKAMAMKLHIPVLAIASLSRKCEERTDKRPMLSDLKDSGEIESDADTVMFLYRDSIYNNEAKKKFPNVTEIIMPKNRGGKTGRALADFDGAHAKFYALEQNASRQYLDFIEGKQNDSQAQSGNTSKVPRGHTDPFFGR